MKKTGLALTALVILGLAGCQNHKTTQGASQDQKLLNIQKKAFTHAKIEKTTRRVRVIVPQSSKHKALVSAAHYSKLATAELKRTPGQTQHKRAYVTFTGTRTARNCWFITPTIRVYKETGNQTRLVATKKLTSLNVNRDTGKVLRIAALARTTQQLQALNYHALAAAVEGKGYSAKKLQEARAIRFLKDNQATNFKLTASDFTVYPAKNTLGIKHVTMPLKTVGGYLGNLPAATTSSKKIVALTFDDGPSTKTTPTVLRILREMHVKATFFMLGREIQANPALAREVVSAGQEVGTHTNDHKNLATMAPAAALQEIITASDNMYAATGHLPMLMRPPYGAVNMAHDNRIMLPSIQWNVDSEDWRVHSAAPIIARVNAEVHPGSIILMHDIHPQSVAALPDVIKSLRAKGYTFVTASELLGNSLLPQEQYFGAGDHRSI